MGWWSEDIMGGDGPCDIQYAMLHKLGTKLDEVDDWGDNIYVLKKVTGTKILEFASELKYYDYEEVWQTIGFQLIDHGLPMTDKVRENVVRATKMEIDEGATSWCSPEGRLAKLREFLSIVESYPREGAKVALRKFLEHRRLRSRTDCGRSV